MNRRLHLIGERVVLRDWNSGELDAMHRWLGNPEVARFLSWGSKTRADSAEHLADCVRAQSEVPRTRYFLAVELRSNGEAIGDAGFAWVFSGTENEARLGYFIEPEDWGNGFATEAARLAANYAFGNLKLDRARAS